MTSQGHYADLDERPILARVLLIVLLSGSLFFYTGWANAEQYCRPPLADRAFSPHLITDGIYFSLRSQWCM